MPLDVASLIITIFPCVCVCLVAVCGKLDDVNPKEA